MCEVVRKIEVKVVSELRQSTLNENDMCWRLPSDIFTLTALEFWFVIVLGMWYKQLWLGGQDDGLSHRQLEIDSCHW